MTFISAVSISFLFIGTASADQFDSQISSLQEAASQAQATANTYQAQAQDYQAKVDQLQAQINALQAQINLNQAEDDQVTTEIAANQQKLDQEKVVLGANIKQLYLDSTVTPLEMLASSTSISQFLDQQQYQDKIKNAVQQAMQQIETLQATLTGQQHQLTQILTNLHGQQAQMNATQEQMNSLLALAQQNAAAANAQVSADNSQISNLRAQQAAFYASLNIHDGSGSNGSFTFRNLVFGGQCGGGYPGYLCDPGIDTSVDPWGMLNRECVSYTAYMVNQTFGNMPYWGGEGNAYQWPSDAVAAGFTVNGVPAADTVAIAPPNMVDNSVGHAMWVDYVESDGWVHVSQYNLWPSESGPYGLYSEMDLKVTPGLEFIHF